MFKIAAIDVGSNAMRMVVGQLNEDGKVSYAENLRLPVRLGQDVFQKGYFENTTIEDAENAFRRFRHIADRSGVARIRAVGTSAAREASNKDLFVDRIAHISGIPLELINAEEEARLIHKAVVSAMNLRNKRTLLIDIGGGSIEVTHAIGADLISTQSYRLGTVRILESFRGKSMSSQELVKLVGKSVVDTEPRNIEREKIHVCVGTGGNVEEIGRLRKRLFKGDTDRLVMLDELEELICRLSRISYKDRIKKLKLRPDRADVILPACVVLHTIAAQACMKQIAIPNVGLKDGVLLELAEELSYSSVRN